MDRTETKALIERDLEACLSSGRLKRIVHSENSGAVVKGATYRDQPRIALLSSGSKRYRIDVGGLETEIELDPSCGLFVMPGAPLAPGPLSPYLMLGIVFHPEYLRFIMIEATGSEGAPPQSPDLWLHIPLPPQAPIRALGELLTRKPSAAPLERRRALLLFEALALESLSLLKREGARQVSKAWHTWSLACEFIQESCHLPLTRALVAKRLKLNASYLSQLAKRLSNETVADRINRARLERAERLLLKNPELTAREVAFACGFNSPSYFSKLFKRRSSETPDSYRRSHGGKLEGAEKAGSSASTRKEKRFAETRKTSR